MVLFHRRKIILAILEKIGGSTSAKCMQKYLFLFTRLQSGERIYDFIPYKYGCFSFVANHDIHILASQGFLGIEDVPEQDKNYTLCHDFGIFHQLDFFDQATITDLVDKFGALSQNELIIYTYKRWPSTAINSIVKESLLSEDELEKVSSFKKRYSSDISTLFTLGYEGISIERYINQLISNDVKVLCDVRKNAFSQKYGFSQATLENACRAVGIKYMHIPELGIDSDKRKKLITQADYDELFDEYERTTLVEQHDYLLKLKTVVDTSKRVCLLCFEKDPRQCHRTRIANAVMALPDVEFKYMPILL